MSKTSRRPSGGVFGGGCLVQLRHGGRGSQQTTASRWRSRQSTCSWLEGSSPTASRWLLHWPGFQAEMARLLADGYDDVCLSKFTSGNGTTEPKGIFYRGDRGDLDGNGCWHGRRILGADLYSVWNNLGAEIPPPRIVDHDVARRSARSRQFGETQNYNAFTATLVEGAVHNLFGTARLRRRLFPGLLGYDWGRGTSVASAIFPTTRSCAVPD